MNPGRTVPVRETVKVVDADHHVVEWRESRDGKGRRTMQVEFATAGGRVGSMSLPCN